MVNACRHHYLIGELASLPPDKGRCKFCGATRTFSTVFVDKGYDDLKVSRPGYFASERDIVGYMADRTWES